MVLGITDKDSNKLSEIENTIYFISEGGEFHYKGELYECISNKEYIKGINLDTNREIELEHDTIVFDNYEDYMDEQVDSLVCNLG